MAFTLFSLYIAYHLSIPQPLLACTYAAKGRIVLHKEKILFFMLSEELRKRFKSCDFCHRLYHLIPLYLKLRMLFIN